ncbi:hypothetical protein GCM10010303_78910 [Streptomyces purpurascens]|nr:hypothetical protein GCM10010303_78910 [Streptomyces purpurascens]
MGISSEVMDELGKADAILFGAMGLPDVRQQDGREVTPQLELRERFQLFASIRPIQQFEGIPRTLRSGNVSMEVIRWPRCMSRRDSGSEAARLLTTPPAEDRVTTCSPGSCAAGPDDGFVRTPRSRRRGSGPARCRRGR